MQFRSFAMSQTRHVTTALRRPRPAFGWLCLGALLGCGDYLRSVCDRGALPSCGPQDIASPADLAPPSALALVRPRQFEWRALLSLESRQSLLGLVGRQLLLHNSISTRSFNIQYYDIDIDGNDLLSRVIANKSSNILSNRILSGQEWLVRTASRYYVIGDREYGISEIDIKDGEMNTLTRDCRSNRGSPGFAHQQLDALAVSCEDGRVMGFYLSRSMTSSIPRATVDALTIADWPDLASGPALMVFRESTIHMTSAGDAEDLARWQEQLGSAVFSQLLGSGRVTAAYVADINRDGQPELLFVQDGAVRAVSYRGREAVSHGGAFVAWPRPLASVPGGETARSVALADLNGDGFPDLVLGTNRSLHLYRNTAGGF